MTITPVLQFGTSRFLQAHADLFLSEALTAGTAVGPITVVQSSGDPDRARRLGALAAPDGYPVRIRGLQDGEVVDKETRVTSVKRTLSTHSDWAELKRVAVEEATFIISNTGDAGYQPTAVDLNADFHPSMSYPAKLLHLLLARFEDNADPIQIMPLELIVDNGAVLKARICELAQDRSLAFRTYLERDVTWVNSLVDRIVSEPLEPAGAVAEPYALWAIEDQPGLKLPCKHASVRVFDRLATVEALKLFILNLGHTLMAENWDTPGATVKGVMVDDEKLRALQTVYQEEVLPAFAAAGLGAEASDYLAVTLDRFANPFLDHRIADIATNHKEKVGRRIGAFLNWAQLQCDERPKPVLSAIAARHA